MSDIIDVLEAEIGTKCEQTIYGTLVTCQDDALCKVVYTDGKQKFLCKKHLRIELNKEIDQ